MTSVPPPLSPERPPVAPPPRGDRLAKRRSERRRRSALVRMWRLVTPLLFVAIAAALVGWIIGRTRARHGPPPPSTASIHMTNPHFYGRSSRGLPYVLVGDDAVRDSADPHLVALSNPALTMQNDNGPPTTVTALSGLLHDDTNRLQMTGNVVMHDGRGDVFHSEKGEVDTVSGDVVGHDHGSADGPSGHNEGDAYTLSNKGDHATFTGRVRTHWITAKTSPAAPAPPAAPAGATTPP